MDYIQIPANAFYYVLGIITGVVGLTWIASIKVKKEEKKRIEMMRTMFGNDNSEEK